MPIEWIAGDLFDNAHDARAFAQGCNCQGSMGAGIAKTFRARYPGMYEEYRRRCKSAPREFNLGECWLWKDETLPWVFNLGTQEGYWRSRASYEAIETSLRRMREQADSEGITRIAMPRIGAGYGGLSWKKVRAIIETVFADWTGTLVVYEEFMPGGTEESPHPDAPGAGDSTLFACGVSDRSRDAGSLGDRSASEADERSVGSMRVINFSSVQAEFGGFSNFSHHPVTLKGTTWPTSEHYFQAQKFAGTPDEEEVRRAQSPRIAARMGRSRKRPLRKDWESSKDQVMYEVVLAKFTQHDDLREQLLGTGDATLVEHTEKDRYWGDGGDGSGRNMLGMILMRVREELRRQ